MNEHFKKFSLYKIVELEEMVALGKNDFNKFKTGDGSVSCT